MEGANSHIKPCEQCRDKKIQFEPIPSYKEVYAQPKQEKILSIMYPFQFGKEPLPWESVHKKNKNKKYIAPR